MSRLRLVALLVVLAAGCRCAGDSSTASGSPPEQGAVQAMPDPYTGLPPRGGVPPLERAAKVLENAGRALASAAARMLGGTAGRRIVVLAGPGGNGGGGLVAARHLLLAGAGVELMLGAPPERYAETPRRQLDIARALGIAEHADPIDAAGDIDLVVDALLGYSQQGAPHEEIARLIRWAAGRRTLSLDVPSGLELSTGTLREPHVVAEETMTIALPKEGLREPGAAAAVGRLSLADISVPPVVYQRIGIPYRTPFGAGPLVEITAQSPRTPTG